jgi:hypothetical protein
MSKLTLSMSVANFQAWLVTSGLSFEEAVERAAVFAEVPEFDGPRLRVLNSDFYNITSPLELAPVYITEEPEEETPLAE